MRKFGIPVLAVAIGIGIGLLIATPRTPAAAEAAREFSIAAIRGEKGGSDVFGPYDVVPDWPKPLSASQPAQRRAFSEVPAAAGREPGVHDRPDPRQALTIDSKTLTFGPI